MSSPKITRRVVERVGEPRKDVKHTKSDGPDRQRAASAIVSSMPQRRRRFQSGLSRILFVWFGLFVVGPSFAEQGILAQIEGQGSGGRNVRRIRSTNKRARASSRPQPCSHRPPPSIWIRR